MTETIGEHDGELMAILASDLSDGAKLAAVAEALGAHGAQQIATALGKNIRTVERHYAELRKVRKSADTQNCGTQNCGTTQSCVEKPANLRTGTTQICVDAPRAPASMTPRATKELPSEVVISKLDTPLPPQPKFPTDYDALQAYGAFNEVAQRLGLPIASKLTPDRVRRCKARLREYGREGWDRALRNLENSKFCTGKTDAGFRADFDFMLQAKSFGRLHDGGYSDKGATRPTASAAPASRVSYDAMVEAECQRIANEMAGIQ